MATGGHYYSLTMNGGKTSCRPFTVSLIFSVIFKMQTMKTIIKKNTALKIKRAD